MRKATRTQWMKFILYTALYLLFLVWVKSWWGLIVVPFIFDAYVSRIIPWSFWRNIKNNTVRSIMGWVDALVFSLIGVYFLNIYLLQNYQIPSSSLEKSLLVGDFLCVSKLSYGPRVPNTPRVVPLTQNTLPIVNTKSYLDWPQWPYKRVAGLGTVKLNDIVVFNFPAGDTVALARQAEDFYSIAYNEGRRIYSKPVRMDTLSALQQRDIYNLYYAAGSKAIRDNPRLFGKVITRPVDRRENYVKRCVGMPGDTLQIIDTQVYLNGQAIDDPENMQLNYFVQTTGPYIAENIFRDLGISADDQILLSRDPVPVYDLPLTRKMHDALAANKKLIAGITLEPEEYSGDLYPLNRYTGWTRDNYGPIWIPRKGATIALSLDNLPLYERCIHAYEGNALEVRGQDIYINGEKADSYTFQMDYYWMMGDNRHKSADSRYWGFVPEDHVVGKPLFVWMSLDKDRGWFDGKIRWNRLFRWVK
ncbi:MAG: S26 family signal peptidase [Prevotellaceae bacterium]|jgi:signal peptidase I|nr:S26 family signal peptidase [Prevotellaceae bacterium]